MRKPVIILSLSLALVAGIAVVERHQVTPQENELHRAQVKMPLIQWTVPTFAAMNTPAPPPSAATLMLGSSIAPSVDGAGSEVFLVPVYPPAVPVIHMVEAADRSDESAHFSTEQTPDPLIPHFEEESAPGTFPPKIGLIVPST